MRRRASWLLLPGAAWLVSLYVVPLAAAVSVSLQQGSVERGYRLTWHVSTYASVLGRYDTQIVRSLVFALVATVICIAVSYPLAYAIAFHSGRARNTLLFLVVLPFFVSLVIRTLSWKFVLADGGSVAALIGHLTGAGHVRLLNTTGAVIAGLVYNYLPFMALPIYVALERTDPRLLEASRDLYGSPAETFRRVTLPLSMPGVVGGVLLTFVPIVGDFINAELLGGPGQEMIGNVIQRQYLGVNDYPAAAALSVALMAVLLAGVVIAGRFAGVEELVA